MFAASKTDSVSASAPDAQFNYVTMLLHGDGTNGAQNNTFLDSSTNNFTITRNGNTTQGSFSPYGSGWSNVFDGSISSAYLSVATNTAFNCGTGNFTVEAFVNITAYTGSYPLIIGNNNGGFSAGAIALTSQNATSGGASKISLTVYDVTSGGVTLAAASTNTIGGWTHFAVVRNGTSLVLYINGASSASTTISSGVTFDWGKNGLLIGGGNWDTANGYYAGYISNLRLVKGTAVYTSAFTPSTTPLTAITNTSLLTCQSNRFIDNSANNFTITANSPSRVERFNPFGTATAYSTSVIGGSGYFDGTGDYLTGTGSSNLAFGSGDFTIELWVYFNSVTSPPSYQFIYSSADSSVFANTPVIYWYETSSSLIFNNGGDLISTTGIKAKTWYHVAVSRSSTTTKMFLNGVQVGSATDSTVYTNQPSRPMIGANGNGSGNLPFSGYISDVRCVKGTAVYTAAFTPPTAPLTAITNTQLLLNYTNGAIFDNAMMNDLETVGNAQISTSVKKYGTGSLAFDGTGDYLQIPYSPNFQFGTGPYTIEFWINTTATSVWIMFNAATDTGIRVFITSTGKIQLNEQVSNADNTTTSTTSINNGAWNHVAFSRASGQGTKLFINGVSEDQAGGAYNFSNTNTLYIGTRSSLVLFLNGYLDDFRITKGVARYTTTFTPPTAALSDTGPI
jgi:hypothetical protein